MPFEGSRSATAKKGARLVLEALTPATSSKTSATKGEGATCPGHSVCPVCTPDVVLVHTPKPDGKDYLVVYDKENIYFLDRQGKKRDGQPESFVRSSNPVYYTGNGDPRLITTDQAGRIHIIDFSGQAEVKEFGKFGSAHRFAPADLDGNGSLEYVFADGKKLLVLLLS